MRILVVDNYDSFVYNLVHILHNLGVEEITVCKNDKIEFDSVENFDKILLSPGPGVPNDAGLMPAIIKGFAPTKSILGICLGHQAIVESFGGMLVNMKEPLHGVASALAITKSDYLLSGIPTGINVGHYHSWIAHNELPGSLEVLAVDSRGNIMALRHKEYDVRGLQFHPESVLTQKGGEIINNWIKGNDYNTNFK